MLARPPQDHPARLLASFVVDKWLELLTPSAAALAIVFAIALVIQSIRHGRALRRLEGRISDQEGAGARVSLDRLRELQRSRGGAAALAPDTPATSGDRDLPPLDDTATVTSHEESDEAPRRAPSPGPRWQPVAAIIAVLAVLGGTTWYLFFRGGEDTSASNGPTTTLTQTGTSTGTRTSSTLPTPGEVVTTASATPKPLTNGKGAYTVKVVNGSGIGGLAGAVTPLVQSKGYNTVPAGNTESQDLTKSFVVYVDPSKIDVADNVAKDFGITRLSPLDGVSLQSEDDAVGVDVILVLGNDDVAQALRP